MLRLIKALPAAALLYAAPALGCSVAEGYRVPTNFELVQRAELIVLGRVVSGSAESGPESRILVEPVRVLKGTLPAEPLTVMGSLRWNGREIPPSPSSLRNAHFSTGIGACIRVFYPKDGLVVAMFGKNPGEPGLSQLFEPFARVVEDVESPEGIWVKAIEAYLELLASAPPETLRQAVAARRDLLVADRSDLAARAIGGDLDDHLRRTGPQPPPPQGPQWRLLDGPMDAGAALMGPSAREPILLYCKSGAQAIEAELLDRRKVGQVELAVGGQLFAAEGETAGTRKFGEETRPVLSATLPFTDALSRALRGNAADVAIRVDGRTEAAAPPLDVLQKLSLRCAALLRPRR